MPSHSYPQLINAFSEALKLTDLEKLILCFNILKQNRGKQCGKPEVRAFLRQNGMQQD